MKKLNGTTSATLFWKTDTNNRPLNLSLTPASTGTTPSNFPIYAADDGLFDFAARGFSSGIAYNAFHVDKKSRVLVLGAKTAEGLGIENLTLARTIYINNEPYTVLGILKSVSEIPELDTAAIIPSTTALELYGPPSTESPAQMMIRTKLGAAQLIARQAPYALRPDAPQYFAVDAPPDWSKATRGVKRSLSGLLLGLAALALFIGCVGIANSTLTSIFERIPEIGLRRALGARAVHVSAQVLGETAVLGLIGGLVGMSLGVVAVLGVCGVQSWTPVLDPLLLVFGPLLGILTGVLAGIYPAVKASRISPISALQHL
jgi:putative ABC transport system permease protein